MRCLERQYSNQMGDGVLEVRVELKDCCRFRRLFVEKIGV